MDLITYLTAVNFKDISVEGRDITAFDQAFKNYNQNLKYKMKQTNTLSGTESFIEKGKNSGENLTSEPEKLRQLIFIQNTEIEKLRKSNIELSKENKKKLRTRLY